MRQRLDRADEPYLFMRSLAVDYAAGGREESHTHAWPQFLYARRGAIRAEIDGRHWIVPTRRGLWIPARTPHRFSMSSRLQLRTLYFRPDQADPEQGAGVVPVSGLLHEAILRVCDQGALDERVDYDRCLGTLIRGEIRFDAPAPVTLLQPADPRAQRLARMFFSPAEAHVRLEALCARAGLSRRTAERLFQTECGLSPAHWRRLAVLSESLVEIAGGLSIDQAAVKAGYLSRTAFSEAFSLAFGFPPSAAKQGGLSPS